MKNGKRSLTDSLLVTTAIGVGFTFLGFHSIKAGLVLERQGQTILGIGMALGGGCLIITGVIFGLMFQVWRFLEKSPDQTL